MDAENYCLLSDLPGRTGQPALSTDPVAVAGPVDAVLAAVAVTVVDLALAVGPERVVEAVVVASVGNDAEGGSGSGDERSEGDHFGGFLSGDCC